jgi:membrane-bound acyltransferase YfiQ involved in biofilm formation
MIAVVFAPAVYYMIRRFKRSVILLFGAVWFVFFNMNQEVIAYFRMTCISCAFFFFYWGAYMSINRVNLMEMFGRFFTPSVVVYVLTSALYVFSVYYFPAFSSFIHWFTICSFIFVAYNVAVWLLKHNHCHVSRFLAGGSFVVYVAHALILSYVEKAFLMALHPADNVSLFAVYMLTLAVTVLSLLGVYYLLKRFAPAVLKVLTGR